MHYLKTNTLARILYYNISSITDYRKFSARKLIASSSPFRYTQGSEIPSVPEKVFYQNRMVSINHLLESNKTIAFLVVKNDNLLYEKYFYGYNLASLSMSFSMAKSFLSILIGCAIDEGYIHSVQQPVTDFVPELAKNQFDTVTIQHLLQMTSGIAYKENDNPFGIHVRYYYTTHLESELLKLKLSKHPGTQFLYKSGDTALLGLVLKRALDTQTITDYMQQRIWEPLGMEYDGLWSIDSEYNGLEKTWCCLSARARDYAKIGSLYLNDGMWNNKQLVPRKWVHDSTRIDSSNGSAWFYQYCWWLVSPLESDYMAVGHLGQYLYVNPARRVVILRLGKRMGKLAWPSLFQLLARHIDS